MFETNRLFFSLDDVNTIYGIHIQSIMTGVPSNVIENECGNRVQINKMAIMKQI